MQASLSGGYPPEVEHDISLDAAQLAPIFVDDARALSVVASAEVAPFLHVINEGVYDDARVITASAAKVQAILESLVDPHHVLVVSTDGPFFSPQSKNLDGIALAVLPLYSTGFSWSKLQLAFDWLMRTPFEPQELEAGRITEFLEKASWIVLRFPDSDESARLKLDTGRPFFVYNQAGPVGLGEQCVVPGGEISLLTDPHGQFMTSSAFALNGDVVVKGTPVVHRGACPCSVVRQLQCSFDYQKNALIGHQQATVFDALRVLEESAVRLGVTNGIIMEAEAQSPGSQKAVRVLEQLFAENPAYRKIHEIGIGIHDHEPVPALNFLPNEMVRGLHFGLGLTPHTPLHIDLTATNATFGQV